MPAHEHVLPHDMLQAFAERCARYDPENRFFQEDFDDLRRAGYLIMAVPKEFGGRGLNLAQVAREQRRLAYYAPATALGINMHIYWVGLAADLWHRGDHSAEWLLKEAMAGGAGGRRLPHLRAQDVLQPGPGVDTLRLACDVG